jgi:hypothetical protein
MLFVEALRPDAADFPLFLHVLGAMTLAGATGAATLVAWLGVRRPVREPLARGALWTLLVVALPAWVVMRIGAQWVYSKEGFSGDNDPDWVGVGFGVADPGLVILLVATGLAFWWSRRGARGAGWAVAVLSTVYLAALAVAWWSMSAKP